MFKKPLIIFEGVEGSGKTYHLNKVAKYLKKKNLSFIKIREPGGNKNSEKIRNLILNSKSSFNKKTDLLLYLAARSENVEIYKKNYKKKNYINRSFFRLYNCLSALWSRYRLKNYRINSQIFT